MAVGSSVVVLSASRRPTSWTRPGTQVSFSRTSTFRPPSAVSVTRKIFPGSVWYTPEGCLLTTPVYPVTGRLPGTGGRRGKARDRRALARRSVALTRRSVRRSGDRSDVRRLGTLRSLGDVELDLLVLVQVLVALARDRAEVHEHVGAVLLGDEAEPLLGAEPLHSSSCHCNSLLPWPVRTCMLSVGLRPGWPV